MGSVVEDLGTGRVKSTGVRDIFQGSASGGASLRIGDVGDEPPYGPVPGGFPSQGGHADYREKSLATSRRNLVVPPPWSIQCRSRGCRRWRGTY